MSEKNMDFLEGLLEESRSIEAVDAIAKLVNYYAKQEPTTEEKRLRNIADDAAWLSTDSHLSRQKRKQYLDIARTVDVLIDGKTTRSAALPRLRIWNPAPMGARGGRE